MIVQFRPLAYSGKCDGLVYYYSKRLDKMIARKWVMPKGSSSNRRIGAVSRNLKSLALSDGYINDLKLYVMLYNYQPREKSFVSWRNAFLTLMYALAKENGAVDLLTITREQIETDDLPCKSVKRAVEAGLIPFVEGYDRLDREM